MKKNLRTLWFEYLIMKRDTFFEYSRMQKVEIYVGISLEVCFILQHIVVNNMKHIVEWRFSRAILELVLEQSTSFFFPAFVSARMAGPIATFIVCLSELNAMNQSEKRVARQVTPNSSICTLCDTIRLWSIMERSVYIYIFKHNKSCY